MAEISVSTVRETLVMMDEKLTQKANNIDGSKALRLGKASFKVREAIIELERYDIEFKIGA